MKKFRLFLQLFIVITGFIGVLGSTGKSSNESIITQENTVTGSVEGTQENTVTGSVEGKEEGISVYIQFTDGSRTTETKTDSNGDFALEITGTDLEHILPNIPDGVSGPLNNLLIIAEKNGQLLRNTLGSYKEEGIVVNISYDTEAYIQFLEAIGKFDAMSIIEFNNELDVNGRVESNSNMFGFINSVRTDIQNNFNSGSIKPDSEYLFNQALQHLGGETLSIISNELEYISERQIMSGGDIQLPIYIEVVSEDILITPIENGRYKLGDGSDAEQTVYLKIKKGDIYNLIAISLKAKEKIQLFTGVVTPQKGQLIGTELDSINISIPPFSISENKNITFHNIDSNGFVNDGRMIMEMEPSGFKFDLPITVKVNYSDFGIIDPLSVDWKYGSIESGYEYADIINIDTNNGFIYLNIDHFSSLVIQSISKQKFIDMGHNFMKMVPRRNYLFDPHVDGYGLNETVLITNKIFERMSLNNEITGGVGGGQCVQVARTILWSFNYNTDGSPFTGGANSNIVSLAASNSTHRQLLRNNFNDIETGDLIFQAGSKPGHTYSVYVDGNKKYRIESNFSGNSSLEAEKTNDYLNGQKYIYQGAECKACTSTMRTKYSTLITDTNFISRSSFELDSTVEDGNFIVMSNPDDWGETINIDETQQTNANKVKKLYQIVDSNDESPSNYYLLNKLKDGIFKENEIFTYEPDLLPVSPLRVSFNERIGTIRSTEDSRYEIYVTAGVDTFGKNNFKNNYELSYEKNSSDNFKNTIDINGINYHRLIDQDDSTEFRMINSASDKDWASVTTDKKVSMLFSPTVIDDYYISWSTSNTEADFTRLNSKVNIGFWSSNGHDMELENPQDDRAPESLNPNAVYRDDRALNGYFMTLGDEKSAQWSFNLAGEHAIFVHVPSGDYRDIQDAIYQYKKSNGEVITLKAKELAEKFDDSTFSNWFILYEEDNGIKTYGFNLGGKESVKVTAKGVTPVTVDAIRFQGLDSIVGDITSISGTVNLSDINDIDKVVVKLVIKDESDNIKREVFVKPSDVNNIDIDFKREVGSSSKLRILFIPFLPFLSFDDLKSNEVKNKNFYQYAYPIESTLDKTSDNLAFLGYKPQSLTINVSEGEDTVHLPKVVLQKNDYLDAFTLKVTDENGVALESVNIDINYGVDNSNEIVSFSDVTNVLGEYVIADMPYGQYTAVISLSGFTPKIINFTVSQVNTMLNQNLKAVVGSELSGSWIADSNQVPGVPEGKYNTSIKINRDGDNYIGTYKSIFSWYPDDNCGLLTSVFVSEFTAEVVGSHLDLTFTDEPGNIRKECNGYWVEADLYDKNTTLRLILNFDDSGILSIKNDSCGWSQNGQCVERTPLFYKFE